MQTPDQMDFQHTPVVFPNAQDVKMAHKFEFLVKDNPQHATAIAVQGYVENCVWRMSDDPAFVDANFGQAPNLFGQMHLQKMKSSMKTESWVESCLDGGRVKKPIIPYLKDVENAIRLHGTEITKMQEQYAGLNVQLSLCTPMHCLAEYKEFVGMQFASLEVRVNQGFKVADHMYAKLEGAVKVDLKGLTEWVIKLEKQNEALKFKLKEMENKIMGMEATQVFTQAKWDQIGMDKLEQLLSKFTVIEEMVEEHQTDQTLDASEQDKISTAFARLPSDVLDTPGLFAHLNFSPLHLPPKTYYADHVGKQL